VLGGGNSVNPTPQREDRIRGFLFDLDGTLVDSRRDLATGINRMRGDRGLPPLPEDLVISHIGWGARNLVARCVVPEGSRIPSPQPDPEGPSEDAVDAALRDFRRHYDDCLLNTTRPYPGIPEFLETGCKGGRAMAVVSNKPERFCRKVLAGLGLIDAFAWVVGGDTLPERKPSPLPLLDTLRRMGRSVAESVMVGDGPADFQAARAAGCRVYMVTWGLTPPEEVESLDPDRVLRDPRELLALLAE
jgi:phosphoglycolate phosphatase